MKDGNGPGMIPRRMALKRKHFARGIMLRERIRETLDWRPKLAATARRMGQPVCPVTGEWIELGESGG